jgi:carboxypeptidase C (cathepsin A)
VDTHHQITVGGRAIAYTATTGYLPMRDEAGKLKANIFYVAYERDGQNPLTRPITFAFNGGPGAAAVWLHVGAFGPRRVVMAEDGQALPPPYRVADNPDTLLDVTDLVFIDPVTTGYSRPAPGEDP